jgi:ATP-binding cassette subfamily C (CFTR/MRP) protein 4
VFTLTSLYEILKASTAESFPLAVIMLAEVKVSITRIQEFLLLDNRGQTKTNYSSLNKLTPTTSGIFLKNISAQWSAREEVLSDVNFSAEVGELVGIAGRAGSGKSTLLQVILKELEPTRGRVDVEMNISYAPQEPWIFSASVKQNILFGEELDESRYLKVMRMCALERDLSVFPFGDNTLVGERGVMLSGGQKARIGLARAVYRNAEIYLLDDPLSAVDGHVADHIFKECLLKFLRNKCLVLVTHQVHFLKTANKIYFLSNGKMIPGGKSELLESLEEKLKTNTNTTALEELPALNYNYQLEVKEDEGKAGNSYKSYCLAGGKGMTGLVLMLFVLVQILSNMVDGFVAFWVNIHQDSVNLVPQIYNFFTDQNCVYIYGALLIVLVFVCHAAVWANVKFCKKASENLHKNLLGKVLVASMSFFNNHSSGRVINRFSKDMGTIDEFIPMTLMEVTTLILSSVGASIVVIIVDYWMIIPSVMLSFVVYFYYAAFQYTIRKFRRMEGTSKFLCRCIRHLESLCREKSNFYTSSCICAGTERDQSVQRPKDIARRI